ncbi:MAG TPA: biotin/lipoyl-containing protein [Anaerolineales bacterium]|nr:biotin/lipoyl-containing protein [Anaerolineales bacterium]
MVKILPVKMTKLSANDDNGTIVEWLHTSSEEVNKGEILCIVETTKSIFEIESPSSGYFFPLRSVGEAVEVGVTIGAITDIQVTQDELIGLLEKEEQTQENTDLVPETSGSTLTLKAQLMAKRLGIDPTELAQDGKKITEEDVRKYAESRNTSRQSDHAQMDTVRDRYPDGKIERVIIIGGGDGAVQVLDVLAKTPGQEAVAILDDNPELRGKKVNGVPVTGGIDMDRIVDLYERGEFDSAVISISTIIKLRAEIFEKLKDRGIPFANIIHPSVVKGINVKMGEGNVIMAFTHLGACASLGNNNFISAYCSIEHHNEMGNHCSFGPGVVTSSRVIFGDQVRCGTGIFIEPKLRIGAKSVIGSGCIIWQDVPEGVVLKSKLNYVERSRH